MASLCLELHILLPQPAESEDWRGVLPRPSRGVYFSAGELDASCWPGLFGAQFEFAWLGIKSFRCERSCDPLARERACHGVDQNLSPEAWGPHMGQSKQVVFPGVSLCWETKFSFSVSSLGLGFVGRDCAMGQ